MMSGALGKWVYKWKLGQKHFDENIKIEQTTQYKSSWTKMMYTFMVEMNCEKNNFFYT